jgi:hypothetical protein
MRLAEDDFIAEAGRVSGRVDGPKRDRVRTFALAVGDRVAVPDRWDQSSDNTDPQSQILYDLYVNGVFHEHGADEPPSVSREQCAGDLARLVARISVHAAATATTAEFVARTDMYPRPGRSVRGTPWAVERDS